MKVSFLNAIYFKACILLKLVSAIFYQSFIYRQMIGLQKI